MTELALPPLPPYAAVAQATGMSSQEWKRRRPLIVRLREYDAGDVQEFPHLLREAMSAIPGQAELAVLLNVSVPTLHRWASDDGHGAVASLSPLQRVAIASLLAGALLHGPLNVRAAMPNLLRLVQRDLARSFALTRKPRAARAGEVQRSAPGRLVKKSRASKT